MEREICFDTETTGLDPNEGHRLIEIGCVEIINGKRTDNSYHVLINPEREVPEEAVRIHHITTEMLADKPKFSEIADSFFDFIKDSTLVAHNAGFDVKFINHELSLIEKNSLTNKVIDSLALAKNIFPNQRNNLDALCKRFNINNTKRAEEGHGALLDAELLADVYIKMTNNLREKLIQDVKKEKTENIVSMDKLITMINKNKVLESRKFNVNEDELQKHNEFINKCIKNSLWDC